MNYFKSHILTTILVILFAVPSWSKVEGVIGGVSVDQNQNLALKLPDTAASEILISREQYLISYNKNRRAPNWVAWKLQADQLGNSGRTNKFQIDTELENYLTTNQESVHAVQATDFKNSCFDRGHQIPSGDRTDTEANNEVTFKMSNMIPQTPYLNRVIWEHLESYTRDLVKKDHKMVYVMAGPIYDLDYGMIGPRRDIPVPSKNFKIIMILEPGQTADDISADTEMIAVIMPNVLKSGQAPTPYSTGCDGIKEEVGASADDWKQYQTTVTEIENKSGLNLHQLLGRKTKTK